MILSTHCTESTSRSHNAQTLRSHSSQYSPQEDTHRLGQLINSPMRDSCCATSTYMDMRYVGGFPTKTPPNHCSAVLQYHLPPPKYCCTLQYHLPHAPRKPSWPSIARLTPARMHSVSSLQPACTRYRHTSPHALGIVTPTRMHSVSSLQPACTRYRHIPSLWTCGRQVESSPPSLEMKVVLYR